VLSWRRGPAERLGGGWPPAETAITPGASHGRHSGGYDALYRDPHSQRARTTMFFFFSNRLGCMGSLLLSVGITLVLIMLFWR